MRCAAVGTDLEGLDILHGYVLIKFRNKPAILANKTIGLKSAPASEAMWWI